MRFLLHVFPLPSSVKSFFFPNSDDEQTIFKKKKGKKSFPFRLISHFQEETLLVFIASPIKKILNFPLQVLLINTSTSVVSSTANIRLILAALSLTL